MQRPWTCVLQTRLRETLREELGGTYSVGVGTSLRLHPDPEYLVQIGFGSDPARAEELTQAVLAEVAWLRGGGEESYLTSVKEILRSEREEQLRRNGFWVAAITATVERQESLDEFMAFEQRLEAISLADVAAAARRYLTPDRYVRVVLLPDVAAD